MVYQYVAYNEKGEVVKGKLSAESEEAATELLNYAGYQAMSLKPYTPFFNLDKLTVSLSAQVKPTEIILLYRQLAMLLESGTGIAPSLELLQQQTENRSLRKILEEIVSDIRGGNQLSTALGKHPKVFSTVYCRLVGAGEQSGDLESVLRQVADYMEKETATAKETKSALMMPAITFVAAIVVMVLMVTFVLPSFTGLYSQLGVDLPPMVVMLMALSDGARSYGVYILLALLVITVAAILYIRTPNGRYKWDKILLSLPRVGRVRHLSELARCCRSMSLLFRSGLPLTEVMPMVVQSSGNKVLSRALSDVQQAMVRGEGLSRPMTKNKIFLPMMVQMVRVGEETGSLDVTLTAVAQSYEAEAEDKMRSLIAMIPTVMTLFLGVVIGLIAMTLMSAMTAMY